MVNGISRPPTCQNLCDQDEKQEISLEWPNKKVRPTAIVLCTWLYALNTRGTQCLRHLTHECAATYL